MEMTRIAGIDPGLRFTGFGIVNYDHEKDEIWVSNCGLVKTPAKFKGIDAIFYMRDQIDEVSKRECFEACNHIVIEMPAAIYSNTFSSGSLLPVACIAGCAFQTFDKEKIIPVYPTVWNKSKKKEKTKALTEEILGIHEEWLYDEMPKAKPQLEHIIDAVGMALWYMKLNYFE
jgi:Holliday junction resolvasome RuvABC endonuclease subunit